MASVEFYTKSQGRSPVEENLNNYQSRIRSKILRQLKYVEEFGLTTAIPNLRKLQGTPFWELRILGKDNVRVVCVPFGKNKVVVLHIFTKKKFKTPQKEIAIAQERYRNLTSDI